MTKTTFLKESTYWGLAYSFINLVHYIMAESMATSGHGVGEVAESYILIHKKRHIYSKASTLIHLFLSNSASP